MAANSLSALLGVLGLLMLLGDAPFVGIAFLAIAALVWFKRTEAETIYGWIFAIALLGVLMSWLFGAGGTAPDMAGLTY